MTIIVISWLLVKTHGFKISTSFYHSGGQSVCNSGNFNFEVPLVIIVLFLLLHAFWIILANGRRSRSGSHMLQYTVQEINIGKGFTTISGRLGGSGKVANH